MRDGLLGLISHVREAKSLAPNLAVTGIDYQMMFLAKLFRESQHVDALIVLHAGQRLRAKPILGEEVESGAADPIVHQRVRARVSRKTCLQAFLENFIELELECVNMSDAGRAGRHPLGLFAPELQEIEIESAIRDLFRAREPFFRNGEQRKTGRQRQRFLCAGQHHIDAERVHVDLYPRKRGHGVED